MKNVMQMNHHVSESVSSRRIPFWDVTKCILIYCVILGHLLQTIVYRNNAALWNDNIFKGIYMFHMPLFALVSGYFAAGSIARHHFSALWRYALRVGVPNAVYWLVTFLLWHSGGTLWFLDFILASCLFLFFVALCKKGWVKSVALGLPLFLLALLRFFDRLDMFPCVTHFTYLYPFFLLGAFLHHQGKESAVINRYWLVALPLFLILIPLFPGDWLVYKTPFRFTFYAIGVDIVRSLVALLGCCACLACCKYISQIANFCLVLNIGKATLALYLLQSLFMEKMPHLWSWLPFSSCLYMSPICALFVLLILYAFYCLTHRIPYIGPMMYGEININKVNKSR